MKIQPDIHTLMTIAETISRLDPDNLSFIANEPETLEKLRGAIIASRMEFAARLPPLLGAKKDDMTAGVKSWGSGPAEQIENGLFQCGPMDTVTELGNVPEGHIIVGLNKSVKDIVERNEKAGELVRGEVNHDLSVEWELTIDINRSKAIKQFLDGLDMNNILNRDDNAPGKVAMSNWYKKRNSRDEWKCQVDLYKFAETFPDNMQMILRFKPDDIEIIAAELDKKDILPLLLAASDANASRNMMDADASRNMMEEDPNP